MITKERIEHLQALLLAGSLRSDEWAHVAALRDAAPELFEQATVARRLQGCLYVTSPHGMSCRLCRRGWAMEAPENHAVDCPLAKMNVPEDDPMDVKLALELAEQSLAWWAATPEGHPYHFTPGLPQDPNGTNTALAAVRAALKGKP